MFYRHERLRRIPWLAGVVLLAIGQGAAQDPAPRPAQPKPQPVQPRPGQTKPQQAPPQGQPQGQPPAGAEARPTPVGLNIKLLLSNPVFGREEFKYLYLQRRWLARQGGSIDAFEKVARDFAQRGALFSGIELLWFAEKMTGDEAKRAALQTQMRQWTAEAAKTEQIVEEAQQLASSKQYEQALDRLYAALKLNSYSEKAHYQLARVHMSVYQEKAGQSEKLIPAASREKVFRIIYEPLNYTLAIDPIFYDAYLAMSNLRELFPDQPQFLLETQSLTERALRFRNEVIPPLESLERNGRDAAQMQKFGAALESTGIVDYAIFAYQTALHLGSTDPAVAEKVNKLVGTYFAE